LDIAACREYAEIIQLVIDAALKMGEFWDEHEASEPDEDEES
jgi:hypothetical protein